MQSSFRDQVREYRFDPSIKDEDLESDDDPRVVGMNLSMGLNTGITNYQSHENYELHSRGPGNSSACGMSKKTLPANGKKTKGRVKIKMEFIDNKLRRYTTFSKRKTGIMKKAYELSTLTGTQVMLLVASETGHVYTFATRKLQPMITSEAGKALIQTCLNSPDLNQGPGGMDQRMSATGFEETDLTYSVSDDCEKMPDSPDNIAYTSELSPTSLTPTSLLTPSSLLPFPSSSANNNSSPQSRVPPPGGGGGGVSNNKQPSFTPTSSTSSPSFTTILTPGGSKHQTLLSSPESSSSQNSISVVQNSPSNLSVVSGSVVLPQTLLQGNNNAVLYHTGQGLVYATPANLPEGVVLNLGQEQGGSQQQFITIPVSLALTPAQQQLVQASQMANSNSTTFSTSSSSGGGRERTRK